MSVQQASDNDSASSPIIPHQELGGAYTSPDPKSGKGSFKQFLKVLGPGLITGASDDDPSGIGTYSVAGASLGYGTLWIALWALPLMITVQYISAKVGMVTGRGLAGMLRKHYPHKLTYVVVFALFAANTINAGVDIGAIAAAINLIVPVPVTLMIIPITVLIIALQVWGSYKLIARVFKWLTLALLAYIGSGILAKPDWGEVLHSAIIPNFQFDKMFITTVIAILGTTISPYLLFWQASQEVEEEISQGRVSVWQRKGATNTELKFASWDVNIGMIVSNVVMFFIILATGATLFKAGKTDIQSATDAAEALRPIAGDAAKLLLAVGLIGAGILAVPVLTGSAAYAISEAFGWKYGLDNKPGEARQFYAIIVAASLIGMLVNFLGINPIQALFWTAVINGLLAPPVLALLMLISANKTIMGDRVNSRRTNFMGWLTTAVMALAAGAFILTLRQ